MAIYKNRRDAIHSNISTSYWLRAAIEAMEKRDPIDALKDAEALAKLMQVRVNEMQGLSETTEAEALGVLREWIAIEGGISIYDATHGISEDKALRLSSLYYKACRLLGIDLLADPGSADATSLKVCDLTGGDFLGASRFGAPLVHYASSGRVIEVTAGKAEWVPIIKAWQADPANHALRARDDVRWQAASIAVQRIKANIEPTDPCESWEKTPDTFDAACKSCENNGKG
jgi:hypothetical protein